MVSKLFIAQALEVVPKLRQVVTLPSKVDLTLKNETSLGGTWARSKLEEERDASDGIEQGRSRMLG